MPHTGESVPMPLVVLTGLSVAGKTTVAAALAAATGLDHWTRSAPSASGPDGVTANALRSPPEAVTDAERVTSSVADRIIALEMLAELENATRPVVVESAALPYLLPLSNTALIVRLSARLPVRISRLRAIQPHLSVGDARTIVRSMDHTARAKMRPTWGVDPESVGAWQWRSDLVVQCPEVESCSDPRECAAITADLVIAAYEAYRGHLAITPATTTATAAADRLSELIGANRNRVRRCTPLLTDPGAEFSMSRWRHRLLIELEQARKAATS